MSSDPSLLEFLKNNPTMFQNYQAIVIKTLLENDSEFFAIINEIKNKIVELNFDREDFEINSGWTSVKKVLDNHNIISINGENVKLTDENISDVEKSECLKICGQKIVEFHIDKIVKGDYNLWRMPPGGVKDNYPYELEFLKSNTIGVGWGKIEDDVERENMTKEQTVELFHKKYRPVVGESNSPQAFTNFTHEMKPKDIIVLIKKKTIIDFAIIVGPYYCRKDPSIDLPDNAKSYSHRRNVVWLNRGSIPESEAFEFSRMSTCDRVKDAQLKEQYVAILRGEIKHDYFLLRHSQKNKEKITWTDEIGEKYHVGRQKDGDMGHNVQKLLDAKIGSKAVWISNSIKKSTYVLGYGTIKSIETIQDGKDWNVVFEKFISFENEDKTSTIKGKKMNDFILTKIQLEEKKSKINWQHSINPIPKKLYQQIIGEDLTSDEEQIDTVSMDNYLNTLDWKPNLVLYGPPGTGKTFIARELAKKIQKKNKLPDIFMLKGPWSNWEPNMARPNPSWATTDVQSNLSQYNLMKIGDYVIFQNNTDDLGPYTGVCYFGIGKITKLFDSSKPFFADEIKEGKILWQKRLEFEIIKKVDGTQMIPRMDGLPETKGLSRIANEDNIRKLLDEIESKWGIIIRTKLITFHPSYSYEDFIEGIRPKTIGDQVTYNLEDGIFKKICNEARKDNQNPKNKYVLIIDEVNRGNISKIFGELITLIEKDKRNNLSINLAYSKKEFSIPDNLYIIGTMNTADKSLIQMDTALRRRFTFMELMPDYELPQIDRKIGKINLAKLLKELNKKIRNQNLRDKQIGHSYFMNITNISELQRVFEYEIIPLLQDYFYDDYDLLEKILGKKIISKNDMSVNHKFINSLKFEDELEKICKNELDDENIDSDKEPVKELQ